MTTILKGEGIVRRDGCTIGWDRMSLLLGLGVAHK